VSEADLDSELEDIANASKSTLEEARDKWQKMGLMAVIAEGVMHRRAVGWLMENVETTEVEETAAPDESKPAEGAKKTAKKRASKKKDEAAPMAGDESPEPTPEGDAE